MIRQYELLAKIKKYNEHADVALLNRAYVFSMKAHGNQKRASGEPYLVHPLEVASILADYQLDEASIAVGLLHDTLEDTLATHEELKNLFGPEIADLTEGVTKLSKIEFNDKKTEQAENFRKLLIAMSKDIRVLLVKLADRLHNMRTLHHISKPEKRHRIAQETMDIYVPLADRVGVHKLKTELENIAFRELDPEEFERIETRKAEILANEELSEAVLEALKDELRVAGIQADVRGRVKATYSIHKKMIQKNLTFDQLTDIVAYRILVDDVPSCYEVLGLVHNSFKAIPGRFKDYISASKPNGYQSLHTSVIGPFGNRMEIQIRTKEMDDIAAGGVAAHWLYKQSAGSATRNTEGAQYKWLQHMMDILQNSEDPEEFIENTKMDLFSDQVFVFTPKGDVFTLPKGATPLDFAYNIHSEIGNHCQTAKVNGRVVPLRHVLRTGDQVEVMTSKTQKPNAGWREFVVSGKARAAINRYLRAQEREEQIRLGREILEKAARREGVSYTEKDLLKVLTPLGQKDVDDLLAGLGQGRLFPRQVFDVLEPAAPVARGDAASLSLPSLAPRSGTSGAPGGVERRDTRVAIDGLTPGIALHIAKCCHPLPGEDIVGIINTGRGITIHSRQCRNLEALSDQPDRWLPVRWNQMLHESDKQVFTARLRVVAAQEAGTLSTFSTAIYNVEGNISDFFIENRGADSFTIRCDVEVHDLSHLDRLLANLRSLRCVHRVERLMG